MNLSWSECTDGLFFHPSLTINVASKLHARELHMAMTRKTAILALPIIALLLVPQTASAVTPQEIVSLSKAGVSDQVILALIDRDQTIFSITSDLLIALKNEGVSEAVVLAMLRSGRQAPAPVQTAPVFDTDPGSTMEIVDNAPDRQDATHGYDSDIVAAPYPASYAVPYIVPYPVAVAVRGQRTHRALHEPVQPSIATAPMSFAAPLPVANTLGPVSVRGMFFTNPSSTAGIFFSARPAVTDCPRGQVSR